MNHLRELLERTISALLMAASVALLTGGLFSYAPPAVVGDPASVGPTEIAGDPVFTPEAPGSTDPTASATLPAASPGGTPSASATPFASATPLASPTPGASPTPVPSATPGTSAVAGAPASRIIIPSLGVDLPILAGDVQVRGNRDSYPLCDVAQYLVFYVHPGQPGTSYIYAHAQRGMFLPLLRASQRNDGAEMVGALVEVYTADNRLHLYEIYRVKRHARDLSLANDVAPGEHMLVLQTSEGTRGHIPKLQLAARPLAVLPATQSEANPEPRPRPCWR